MKNKRKRKKKVREKRRRVGTEERKTEDGRGRKKVIDMHVGMQK